VGLVRVFFAAPRPVCARSNGGVALVGPRNMVCAACGALAAVFKMGSLWPPVAGDSFIVEPPL